MSGFWSAWIIFFVTLNWGLVTFLLVYSTRVPIPTQADGTTGHVWAHGAIREGVRRLPLWWVLLSAFMIVFAVFYLVLYPGFGSYSGTLGWSAAEQVQTSIARNAERRAALVERATTTPAAELAGDPQVLRAAAVLFEDNCAACHGRDGRGNTAVGAPDLTDDAWLYGDGEAIRASIAGGRGGVMPALGAALGEDGVREVAAYVYRLNGRDGADAALAEAGKARYQTLCIACHGPDATGNPALGAPNLSDDAWLYGGELATIETSVRDGRQGKMPAWDSRLSDADISMLSAWIHAAGAGRPSKAGGAAHE